MCSLNNVLSAECDIYARTLQTCQGDELLLNVFSTECVLYVRALAMSCSSFQTRRSSFMSSTSSGRLTTSAARPASLLDTHKHIHRHKETHLQLSKYNT